MEIRVLKLGAKCLDRATELEGTLTHWICGMDQNVRYLFQPSGLDEEGQPVKKLLVCGERLDVGKDDSFFEEIEIPFEILGTVVTDGASGFKGMAVEFVRHLNGCFHVSIQPKGRLPKNNAAIASHDFDLRGCTGEKIREMTDGEKREDKKRSPSPSDATDRQRRLPD